MLFLSTHAGRATFGICAAAWLIAWPPPSSWVLATFLLLWSLEHFREAFRPVESLTVSVRLPSRDITPYRKEEPCRSLDR